MKDFEFSGFHYKADEFGKIYGKNDIELKQRLNSDGYPIVSLGNDKIKRTV